MKTSKKFLSVFMALVLSITLLIGTNVSAASDYEGHWAQAVIKEWVSKGYIKGFEDGTFRPNNEITRAAFVTLVNAAFGFKTPANVNFSDIKSTDWYYNAVACAIGAGYISGFEDNTFRPNDTITREQAAIIITNILKLTPSPSDADFFTDSSKLTWSKGSVGAAVKAKLLSGFKEGNSYSFKPKDNMTRAQAVVSLDNTLKQKDTGSGNLTPAPSPKPTTSPGTTTDINKDVTINESSYGPSSGITNIKGNVTVTSTASTVTLKNLVISKDLTISANVNKLVLQNVTVNGKTYANGSSDITMTDGSLGSLDVKASKTLNITLKDFASVISTTLKSPANLTMTNSSNSKGFRQVIVDSSLRSSSSMSFSGDFPSVEIGASNTTVKLTKGSIDKLYLSEDASGATVELSSGTTVYQADIYAKNSSVKGAGTVKSARVEATGVKLQRKPSTLTGSKDPTYVNDKTYTVTFTIHNGNNVPVYNATVEFDGSEKSTDSDGKVSFSKEEGEFEYNVYASGFKDSKGNKLKVSNTTSKTVKLSYSSRYDLDFTIRNNSNSKNVENATVTITNLRSLSTNSSGRATFNNVENGVYSYRISKSGFTEKTGTITVRGDFTETIYITPKDSSTSPDARTS